MIKAVAFDFGGVYFQWDHWNWFNQAGKKMDVPGEIFKEAYLNECSAAHKGHITAQEHFKHMSKFIQERTGKKLDPKKIYQTMFVMFQPLDRMVKLAKKLRENGYKIMLFSNHTTMMDDLNDKWDFYKHFDHPIVSVHVGMEKPEPEFYHYLIKTAGCKPEEIVFIDDIERNVTAGRKEGIDCILFDGNMGNLKAELKKRKIKV